MNSLPPNHWSSTKGFDLLRRTIDGYRYVSEPLPNEGYREVPLEPLVERGEEPTDESYTPELWLRLVSALDTDMNSKGWGKALSTLDAETLARLVDTLDDYYSEYVKRVGEAKFRTVRSTAGVMLLLTRAIESGKGQTVIGGDKAWARVSDYLYVMVHRERARSREIPRSETTNRALARSLGVSDKTIAAWDERAERLGVTLDDWDSDRLESIVKPRKRAPP
jgi:hypothetical protein